MGNIYTGIDIGSNSIKIVVCEKTNKKYNVLACCSTPSYGIKNGQIVDMKGAVASIKKCASEVEKMLGFSIYKVIACVPPTNCKMDILIGTTDVINPSMITGVDVSNVLNEAIKGYKLNNYEIITASPISFIVDDEENIKDPKGMSGDSIEAKIVIGSVPREPLIKILEAINLSGLETVDVAFTSTGDYFATAGDEKNSQVGAIINIGEYSTDVSIFNKGIQIKHALLPIGSFNVDKDLAYIYSISSGDAKKIKENFALAMSSYADSNETIKVICNDKSKKEISQTGVTKVAESRIREILKVSKNEIKNLTNREIRYIIVTGGLSELQGFNYLIDDEFKGLARACKISTMGIRHNKYSSAFGVIKYFDEKLTLRGKSYDMVEPLDRENMVSTSLNSDNILGKEFGHLYD